MYAEGIFDKLPPETHHNDHLPQEVFLLERMADVDDFLASSKDLALGKVAFPANYDQLCKQWIDANQELNVEVRQVSELDEHTCPLAKSLMTPFTHIWGRLEGAISSRKRLTIKVVRDQMCPLFHVDRVLARFIVTVEGAGTQWLQEKDINRQNLGKAGRKPIIKPNSYLQQITLRQVAILKGSRYNGSKGLVHRSPPVNPKDDPRLILRLDFK